MIREQIKLNTDVDKSIRIALNSLDLSVYDRSATVSKFKRSGVYGEFGIIKKKRCDGEIKTYRVRSYTLEEVEKVIYELSDRYELKKRLYVRTSCQSVIKIWHLFENELRRLSDESLLQRMS